MADNKENNFCFSPKKKVAKRTRKHPEETGALQPSYADLRNRIKLLQDAQYNIQGRKSIKDGTSDSDDSNEDSDEEETKSLYQPIQKEKYNIEIPPYVPQIASQKPGQVKSSTNFSTLATIAVLFVTIIFVCLFGYRINTPTTKIEDQPPFSRFLNSWNELQKKYPGQEAISWRVIKATAKGVLNVSFVERPGVIILLYEKEADSIALRLAEDIASSFMRAVKNDTLYVDNIIEPFQFGINVDHQKLAFDQKINKSIEMSATVIIKNFDKFDFEVISLLHGFCDDTFAPLKKAFYILTLQTNSTLPVGVSSTKTFDRVASDIITKTWSKIPDDYIYPLLSRIMVNVVGIRSPKFT